MVALGKSDWPEPILNSDPGMLNARCRHNGCAHVWTIAYLPMPMESVTLLMQRAACPMCADLDPFVMPQASVEPRAMTEGEIADYENAIANFDGRSLDTS